MGKRQITRGSELATYAMFAANRDSYGAPQRTPSDTRGGFGHTINTSPEKKWAGSETIRGRRTY
ncbi:hypothetical protein GCM10011578_030380 [Streptomyces fuscichromogenes]|uniref:Uncharacterized protein n=1 Tax=Streptomyces fuscichromogenes TaxID=1324013 RepID=A0A917XBV4_9ACTN|nr:hypothetical protein GCM10011578_030380 [Streptomyces fuscichromogenes]